MVAISFQMNGEKVLLAKPILQSYWTRTSEIHSEAQTTWSSVTGESKVLAEERGEWERFTLLGVFQFSE